MTLWYRVSYVHIIIQFRSAFKNPCLSGVVLMLNSNTFTWSACWCFHNSDTERNCFVPGKKGVSLTTSIAALRPPCSENQSWTFTWHRKPLPIGNSFHVGMGRCALAPVFLTDKHLWPRNPSELALVLFMFDFIDLHLKLKCLLKLWLSSQGFDFNSPSKIYS